MKFKQINYKNLTFALLAVCIVLTSLILIEVIQEKEMLYVEGFKVPRTTFDNFIEIMDAEGFQSARICSLEQEGCISLSNNPPQ